MLKYILLFSSGFVFGDAMGIWRGEFAHSFSIPVLIIIGCGLFVWAWIYERLEQKRGARKWFDDRINNL